MGQLILYVDILTFLYISIAVKYLFICSKAISGFNGKKKIIFKIASVVFVNDH